MTPKDAELVAIAKRLAHDNAELAKELASCVGVVKGVLTSIEGAFGVKGSRAAALLRTVSESGERALRDRGYLPTLQ